MEVGWLTCKPYTLLIIHRSPYSMSSGKSKFSLTLNPNLVSAVDLHTLRKNSFKNNNASAMKPPSGNTTSGLYRNY